MLFWYATMVLSEKLVARSFNGVTYGRIKCKRSLYFFVNDDIDGDTALSSCLEHGV